MKKYFMKLMSRLLHSRINQVMWYFCVFIVNPFCLLWSIFFSRELHFPWSPFVLLIAEWICLDTSGEPTVGFFLKITSPSWIILSISLDELHLINLSALHLMMKFLEILLYYCKKILVWQKILVFQYYFLNIIVNVSFFSELKFKYYCEYYREMLLQASLKQETRTDGRSHEIFFGKFTGPWNI